MHEKIQGNLIAMLSIFDRLVNIANFGGWLTISNICSILNIFLVLHYMVNLEKMGKFIFYFDSLITLLMRYEQRVKQ